MPPEKELILLKGIINNKIIIDPLHKLIELHETRSQLIPILNELNQPKDVIKNLNELNVILKQIQTILDSLRIRKWMLNN